MNSFTWKLWQHLNHRKNADGGFTLIELLVVIIIIGILSAIALPTFLNQANKAKEIEPQVLLNNANKEQYGHYLEKADFKENVKDFSDWQNLEDNDADFALKLLGLSHKTENYFYGVETASNVGDIDKAAAHIGFTKNPALKSYLGAVYLKDGDLHLRMCKASMSELMGILNDFLAGNIDELESEYCNKS